MDASSAIAMIASNLRCRAAFSRASFSATASRTAPVAVVQQQHAAPVNGKAGSNGHVQKNGHAESADFQGLKQAMQLCLNAAYGVCEGLEVELPFTTEDVRALGITLFIECNRKGILPQESEGLPF